MSEKPGKWWENPAKIRNLLLGWGSVAALVWGSILAGSAKVSAVWTADQTAQRLETVEAVVDTLNTAVQTTAKAIAAEGDVPGQLGELRKTVEMLATDQRVSLREQQRQRIEDALATCRTLQRRAGQDGEEWTRDCAQEYADALDAFYRDAPPANQ